MNRHSLRGSVDWNYGTIDEFREQIVTPYAGVWIEIPLVSKMRLQLLVTPYAGVWIEISFEYASLVL